MDTAESSTTGSSGTPAAAKVKPEGQIGPFRAIANALIDRPLAHFPRFPDERGAWQRVPDNESIRRISQVLAPLDVASAANLDDYLHRGRESLDEVKELTEYQDQKATRLLTIIAFLSALSGVLFARFMESYPLHLVIQRSGVLSLEGGLVISTYALFCLFALLAICGALVIFHAIRTQFRYPDLNAPSDGDLSRRAKSYLFFNSIVELTPEEWALSFLGSASAAGGRKLAPELKLRYLRNYITESYLIAAKVADKLRYLQPGQALLSWSIRALLVWLLVYAIAVAIIPGVGAIDELAPETVTPPGALSLAGDQPSVEPLQPLSRTTHVTSSVQLSKVPSPTLRADENLAGGGSD